MSRTTSAFSVRSRNRLSARSYASARLEYSSNRSFCVVVSFSYRARALTARSRLARSRSAKCFSLSNASRAPRARSRTPSISFITSRACSRMTSVRLTCSRHSRFVSSTHRARSYDERMNTETSARERPRRTSISLANALFASSANAGSGIDASSSRDSGASISRARPRRARRSKNISLVARRPRLPANIVVSRLATTHLARRRRVPLALRASARAPLTRPSPRALAPRRARRPPAPFASVAPTFPASPRRLA
mmetsp:Transcript_6328/g.25290  ORF Transcript_6328/g.25290 Transcript_6328/m.25290 type:complete len:253 (+) Transcript_6328:2398-3156(+)